MIRPVTATAISRDQRRSAALGTRVRATFALALLLSILGVAPANAADLPPGFTLTPTVPRYLVLRDAYVRAAPDNNAERIGGVAKGQRIAVVGKILVPKTKDTHWIAVKLRGGRTGYVFGTALVAAIDGALKAPLTGALAAPDRPDCRYTVTFEGKSQVADDVQQTADYDVALECVWRGTPLAFGAGMFITELPFQERHDVFQINIDLWDMRVNDEDVLSVTALYDPMAQRVAFESVNDETLGSGNGVAPAPAADVPAALSAALAIAHKVWQERAWEILASMPKPELEVESDEPAELTP
jgi:hypothetical protein